MNVKSGDPPSSSYPPVGTAATHSLAAGGVHRIEDRVHRQDPSPAYSTTMHHPLAHPSTSVIVHGSEWVEEPVFIPIGGMVPRLHWSVRGQDGRVLTEGCDTSDRTPFDYFMMMFPQDHLAAIARKTNIRLIASKRSRVAVGEILKFFGGLVLMSRFEFGTGGTLVVNTKDKLHSGPRIWSYRHVAQSLERPVRSDSALASA
jgi:hypothetical protein